MSSVSLLLAMSAISASPPVDASPVRVPDEPALLMLVTEYRSMGPLVGIEAIDATRSLLDERNATKVAAGLHTVWYSCPGVTRMDGGPRLSFEFEAGAEYELVCRPGQDALIRRAENC